MTPDQHVAAITARIEARMAQDPEWHGDYFALTEVGREAVRRILEEEFSAGGAP